MCTHMYTHISIYIYTHIYICAYPFMHEIMNTCIYVDIAGGLLRVPKNQQQTLKCVGFTAL